MSAAGRESVARSRRRLAVISYGANGIGASVVVCFMLWLAPSVARTDLDAIAARTPPVFAVYLVVALPVGHLVYRRAFAPVEEWLLSDRPPTDADRLALLGYPRRWAVSAFALWVGGAVTFAAVNVSISGPAAMIGAAAIVLGAMTACALQYVLVERVLRPVAALTLAGSFPRRQRTPGVRGRLTTVWLLTTGVPLAGILSFSAAALIGDLDATRVVLAAFVLALIAIVVGLASTLLAGASLSTPLRAMRDALARIEEGDLTTRVTIDDVTETGLLQAGFNRMATGLSERERLREALGVFVDPRIADRVIREGVTMRGEEVELSVLFLDVRDFTSFSENRDPQQVVAQLNDLYGLVVPILRHHRGYVDKFIGDGLLAVFGALDELDNHAESAVAAAVEVVGSVRTGYDGSLRVGVGVNSGPVVVGTVGGGDRLDLTVIGDTVNTASRVESATRLTGDDVLITEATHRLLSAGAASRWSQRPAMSLKGKQRSVRLFGPGVS